MKKFLLILSTLALFIFITACNQTEPISEQQPEVQAQLEVNADYLTTNLAIVDDMIRSLDDERYVRQVLVVDFKKTMETPNIFGSGEDIFFDDGTGYDLVANDGIFTSQKWYRHGEEVAYDRNHTTYSISAEVFHHEAFKHTDALNKFIQTYEKIGFDGVVQSRVEAEEIAKGIKFCHCPTDRGCWCLACEAFDTYCWYWG